MIKRGLLFISSSRRNLFLTVTDLKRYVLFSCSAGQVRESKKKNRRYKKSPGAMINLAQKVCDFLLKSEIKSLNIVLKITPKFIIKNLIKQINSRGVTIKLIWVRIPYTFSSVRPKKLRRI